MKIGEILIHQKSITQEDLELALWLQKHWGGLLGRILVSRGFVPEAELVAALSTQLGVPSVNLQGRCTPAGLCRLLPLEACIANLFLAFGQDPDSGTYLIAMADPRDTVALAALRAALSRPFRVHLCGHLELTEALYRLSLLLREPAVSRKATSPMAHRALVEVIEADGLVEEIGATGRSSVATGPAIDDDDLEVLEESEMLAAMAAQAAGGRTSGERPVIVESGDFEIVSSDELPEEKPADGDPAAAASDPPGATTPKADVAAASPDKKGDDGAGAPLEPDQSADKTANTPQKKTDATAEPARKAEPGAEPGSGRRSLLAALAGGPREPDQKTPEKKPPPSPFSSRDKK